MSIEFDPSKNMVRVGEKFFPAKPFPTNGNSSPYGKGYTIPLGESGKELSIAIGAGTYSDNYELYKFENSSVDVELPMRVVEVGFNFGDEPSPYDWQETRGFEVTGYINDEELSRMIIRAMSGENPF